MDLSTYRNLKPIWIVLSVLWIGATAFLFRRNPVLFVGVGLGGMAMIKGGRIRLFGRELSLRILLSSLLGIFAALAIFAAIILVWENSLKHKKVSFDHIIPMTWQDRSFRLEGLRIGQYTDGAEYNNFSIWFTVYPETLKHDDRLIFLSCLEPSLAGIEGMSIRADSRQGNGKFYLHSGGIKLAEHENDPLRFKFSFDASQELDLKQVKSLANKIDIKVQPNCQLFQ